MLFLRYDATKASIDEATTTERQRRVRFPCVICDRACGVNSGHAHEIRSRSVRVLGPSWVHVITQMTANDGEGQRMTAKDSEGRQMTANDGERQF